MANFLEAPRSLLKLSLIVILLTVTIGFAARLPNIGGDSGSWGSILNEFLSAEHTANGSHKNITVHGNASFLLPSDENINIDGSSEKRSEITLGLIRLTHTPNVSGTRSIFLQVNNNNFTDTKGIVINYAANGFMVGVTSSVNDMTIDATNSSGGLLEVFKVSRVNPLGSVRVIGLGVAPGIGPIRQLTGGDTDMDMALIYNGSFRNITANLTSSTSNIEIFVNNGDYLYIGHSQKFSISTAQLTTPAGGGGIKPDFEYSNDSLWIPFFPNDGTNGLRTSGSISWDTDDLADWVNGTVNGTNKFWVRIKRTANSIPTIPVESIIQVNTIVEYFWNREGNISANKINAADNLIVSGNIGVGTATPQNKLTVLGHGNFTSNLTVSSGGGRSGITLYNETNHPWCVVVTGNGTLQTISGSCGG